MNAQACLEGAVAIQANQQHSLKPNTQADGSQEIEMGLQVKALATCIQAVYIIDALEGMKQGELPY